MTRVVANEIRSASSVGRPLVRRLRLEGWLRLDTPLHVGGLGADPSVDLAVAVDGLSRLYVPGTSLAGALRAVAARVARDENLKEAWGYVPQGKSDAGWASRMVVRDGLITTTTDESSLLPRAALETRSGIGIDRVLGTVASNFLYARAVVPRGAFLRLRLDLESPLEDRDEDPATAMFASLLSALSAGRVRLGAVRTGGLGRVTLVQETLVEHKLTSPAGLLDAIGLGDLGLEPSENEPPRSGGPLSATALGVAIDPYADQLRISVEWSPRSPVMVGSGVEGFAVKVMPLVAAAGPDHEPDPGQRLPDDTPADQVTLVLPGRSIKGAFRSHAERIERTVLRLDAPSAYDQAPELPADHHVADDNDADPASVSRPQEIDRSPGSRAFRAQLAQLDASRALFGAAGTRGDAGAPEPPWGVGALVVDECYSKRAIPGEVWRQVVGSSQPPEDAEAAEAARQAQRPVRSSEHDRARISDSNREALAGRGIDQADHVAIDRWTGGAADKRLYSTLEPYGAHWQPLTFSVDLGRLATPAAKVDGQELPGFDPDLADAALALLLLLLRDLRAGRVRLGYGTNRGHGDVTVSAVTVTGFPGFNGTADLDSLLGSPAVAELGARWRRWVDQRAAPSDDEAGSRCETEASA